MSRILSRISMLTGQISSHALQLVHAQSSSDVMRSNTLSAPIVMSRVDADRRRHRRRSPVAAITSPTFSTISRGSSGLPVACAGHTDVQRPQIVHASVSNSCFQVKSSIVDGAERLELGLHEVRHRLHRALRAGRGRCRYMFIGDVNMCRSFVVGRITRNARNATTCTPHSQRCASRSVLGRPACRRAPRAGSRRTTTSRTSGRPTSAMRSASVKKPVRPMHAGTCRGSPRLRAWS